MPYAALSNFSRGLDSRSHHLTAQPGSLEELTNGHITRGGDIEKRKSFTLHKALPANTFGLEVTLDDGLVVFGSVPEPTGMPSGVTYQRLAHPKATAQVEEFDCPADVSGSLDGTHFKLYDEYGTVAVWIDVNDSGTAEPSHGLDRAIEVTGISTNDSAADVATAIAAAIDADSKFSAVVTGSVNETVQVTHTVAGDVSDVTDVDAGIGSISVETNGADSVAMTDLVFSTAFSGKTWALATYSDGLTLGFYNGALINDYHLGVVRNDHTALSEIAEEIAAEIDDSTEYSAASNGTTLTISGAAGEDFTPVATTVNASGGTDDQTITFTTASEAVSTVAETQASCDLQISGTAGTIDKIDIGSVTIYSGFQVETFDCVADVAGSLDGTYFQLNDEDGSVGVWIDVDDSGTAAPSGATALDRQIEVTGVVTGDSATSVATAVASAINGDSKFSASSATATVTVTHATAGDVGDGVDGDTGFTSFAVTVDGAGDWVASNANTATSLAEAINNFTPTGAPVGSVTITDPGEYLLIAPTITFDAPGGGGSTATGYAVTDTVYLWGNDSTVSNSFNDTYFHRVTSVVVTSGGSGYTSTPSITFGGSYKNYRRTFYGEAISFATKDPTYTVTLTSSNEPTMYTATASGDHVIIKADAGAGTSANGLTVDVDVDGTSTYTSANITVTHDASTSGGVDAVAGAKKVVEADFAGTLDEGDKFTITLTDSSLQDRVFGASRVAGITPVAARTLKQKVYVAAGSSLYFCETAVPTSWQDDDFGSGVINITENFGGSAPLTGLGTYQNSLAVFSRRSTQIWYVDPSAASNQQLQTIDNVGALSANSIVSIGDSDVFFVSDSGIRSLRVRDSSGNAAVTDVGTPIDTTILTELASLTEAQKADIPAVMEPIDGRYWVVINGTIYVYTQFPGSRIAAWSTYDTQYNNGGTLTTMGAISKMVAYENRVYLRGGDNIFIYGGSDNATYDASICTVEIPYISAGEPSTDKFIGSMDFAVDGSWDIDINTNPNAPTAWEHIGEVDESNFAGGSFGVSGMTTHVKARLKTTGSEAAKIASIVTHYRKGRAS